MAGREIADPHMTVQSLLILEQTTGVPLRVLRRHRTSIDHDAHRYPADYGKGRHDRGAVQDWHGQKRP
jgi:hypothetical protein